MLSTLGGFAALAVPAFAAALVIVSRSRTTTGALAFAVGIIAIAWLVARSGGPIPFEAAESARAGGVLGALGIATFGISGPAAVRRAILRVGAPRLVDLTSAAVALGTIAGLWIVSQGSPAVVLLAVVVLVVAYPAWRRMAIRLIDGMLIAGIRERASIAATEAERRRLARELHDSPLQELSGVIKRLEVQGATGEVETLRGLADQLRTMTTELYPPTLHDIGLGAALEMLVEHTDAEPLTVDFAVVDLLEPAQARLPQDVEIAAYRIVQEALRNAVLHSGGSWIRVDGTLTPDRLALRVTDDGVGLDERSVRAAEQAGHFGVGVMRQRAASIDARLEIRVEKGTVLQLTWDAATR